MKIISNFHDYYDAIGAYDRDAEPVYVRQTQEIILNQPSVLAAQECINRSQHLNGLFFPQQVMSRDKYSFGRIPGPLPVSHHLVNDDDASAYQERSDSGYISFCGKVYPFYIMNRPDGEIYCYNIEQYINAIKLINPINKKKILESIESGEYQMKHFSGKKFIKKDFISRATWSKFTTEYNNKVNVEHYRYFKCPVALRRHKWHGDPPRHNELVILNPRLNQYNFQSQIDPFTAYQELSMYLGNELVDTSNMTPQPITDVMRAETKGFNEWSFRRHKTEDSKYKKKYKE